MKGGDRLIEVKELVKMGYKVEITKGEQAPYFVEVRAIENCRHELKHTFLGGIDLEYLLQHIIDDIKTNEQQKGTQ